MPRMAPHTARMRQILSDGRWHTREELIVECGPLIEPGRAMRQRERARVTQRKSIDYRPQIERRVYSDEYYIAIGRRSLIVESFSALKGLEFRDMHGRRWIRDKKAHEALLKERRDERERQKEPGDEPQ